MKWKPQLLQVLWISLDLHHLLWFFPRLHHQEVVRIASNQLPTESLLECNALKKKKKNHLNVISVETFIQQLQSCNSSFSLTFNVLKNSKIRSCSLYLLCCNALLFPILETPRRRRNEDLKESFRRSNEIEEVLPNSRICLSRTSHHYVWKLWKLSQKINDSLQSFRSSFLQFLFLTVHLHLWLGWRWNFTSNVSWRRSSKECAKWGMKENLQAVVNAFEVSPLSIKCRRIEWRNGWVYTDSQFFQRKTRSKRTFILRSK